MAVWNMASGGEIREKIEREVHAANVDTMALDLSSMAYVKKFALDRVCKASIEPSYRLNTNGQKGMRLFNVFMQGKKASTLNSRLISCILLNLRIIELQTLIVTLA